MNIYFFLMLVIGLAVAVAMSVTLIRVVLRQVADRELRPNPRGRHR